MRPSFRRRILILDSSTTTTTTSSSMAASTRTISNDITYRLRHFETTVGEGDLTTTSPFKRQRRTLMTMAAEVSSSSSSSAATSMKEGFANYALYLNELNDKRERVMKASHDVTINSKKVIFQVHRLSKENKNEVLEKAEKDLATVTNHYVSKLINELQGTDFWKVQEYVEAATLCKFCKTGVLLNLEEFNASLRPLTEPAAEPLHINVLDYILGLADLTGELMKLASGRISDGELDYAQRICKFVPVIHRVLTLVVPLMDDNFEMKKMDTMLQSVLKIETACFSVHVRGSEYIPLLGSEDTNYDLFSTTDFQH